MLCPFSVVNTSRIQHRAIAGITTPMSDRAVLRLKNGAGPARRSPGLKETHSRVVHPHRSP